jgi:AcrR family transcriptional regulator
VRERLYAVALRRIRSEGFDATSVSAVTREADVAKGTFFNHFATKDHLLARVLDEVLDRITAPKALHSTGTDAVAEALDRLALELASDPFLARAIVPRLGTLPVASPPSGQSPVGQQAPAGRGSSGDLPAHERIRRWVRDRLAESLRLSVPLEEPDDQTLSVLLVATFEATLREWVAATGGEPPFPRRLLHGRIVYLLVSAGFPRPPAPA